MDQTTILAGLLAALVWTLYRFIIFPVWRSPLRNIPNAHPTSAVSSQWFKRRLRQLRELKTLYAVHARHGPIVRLAPNEISVVSQEGLRKIYVAGFDKTEWYRRTFLNYGVQNLVCTLDHKTHSQVRRMIAPLYAKSYLQRSKDLDELSRRIVFRRLVPMLDDYARQGTDVNVVRLFEWTGVDFVSGFIFGNSVSTDFLNDANGRERYFGEWDRLRESPDSTYKPVTEDLFMTMCKNALSSPVEGGTQPLVIARMHAEMSARAKEWELSEEDVWRCCASEMLDHILATQETQTITWTYILYRLSLHPEMQRKLRTELETLQPLVGSGEAGERLPSLAEIDRLVLLDATVMETLRLHAANPARMQRVVPKEGLTLHGNYVPPRTIVSTNAYCLHRNVEIFPEPFEWKPERWVDHADKDFGHDTKQKWFWAFGSGPRMCIGQHFAVQILKLVVALIYTHYTTEIVDDEGIEQSDSYNSGPISHRLVLRLRSVHDADPRGGD